MIDDEDVIDYHLDMANAVTELDNPAARLFDSRASVAEQMMLAGESVERILAVVALGLPPLTPPEKVPSMGASPKTIPTPKGVCTTPKGDFR